MTPPQPSAPASGGSITPNDILFVIFRHKWKIITCSLLGFIAAAAIWLIHPRLYESHAKILVRYVMDSKSALETGGVASPDVIKSPDVRGSTVLRSEMEIMTSSDLIRKAVEAMTASKVLAKAGGGTNLNSAAGLIARNFQVEAGKGSSVLELTLAHQDPEVAQTVLGNILTNYFKKHFEIHRGGASYEDLQAQTENVKTRLMQTEEELRSQKRSWGIIDLQQSKTEAADRLASIQKLIFETQAQFAEQQPRISSLETNGNSQLASINSTKDTNSTASAVQTNTPAFRDAEGIPQEDLLSHNYLIRRLATLRDQETELLTTYTDTSTPVSRVRKQISTVEQALRDLGIDPTALFTRKGNGSPAGQLRGSADASILGQFHSLQAKYQFLTNQLAQVRLDAARLDAAETAIAQVQRRKELEEQQYMYYSKSLEQARLDQAIDANKLNNIAVIQQPTPGSLAMDKSVMKIIAGAAFGGIGVGLALAFLLDFILDPSVKRSKDLESNLHLPVFATIPSFGVNGHSLLKGPSSNADALQKANSEWNNGEIPPWEDADPMLPYYEALRDRVVMSYTDDSHKPKIVGLTSCNKGAGVTRLATGLAAALSRDVPRNVLLIALEQNKVAVSAFSKGRPADQVAENLNDHPHPDAETEALVQQDLQSLMTTGRNRVGASIVQSFTDLMPRLKLCDYDYVIFDLPPISQTTGSIRLASQMERTLLVVEAEETSKDKIKKAKSLLQGSKTRLVTVLNKTKNYGPKSMHDTDI